MMLTVIPDQTDPRRVKLMLPETTAREVWETAREHPDVLAANDEKREGVARAIITRHIFSVFPISPKYNVLQRWPESDYQLGAGIDGSNGAKCWLNIYFNDEEQAKEFVSQC